MEMNKQIREPKQTRSIQKKEKILDAALKLFCEKGYNKTTTNEIAKTAGVNIASLYSYFEDRDTIFYEILDRYHKQFAKLYDESINTVNMCKIEKEEWLYTLIEGLIGIHEQSKEFNKELKALYYSNPKVKAIMDKQNEERRQVIVDYFLLWKNDFKINDFEATAIITYDFITSIVDRIVLNEEEVFDKRRILQAGVEAIFKFLML